MELKNAHQPPAACWQTPSTELSAVFPKTQGMTQELIEQLGMEERMLLRRHGVRLRVDGITRDRRYALCSAYQAKRPFLRPLLSNIELVAMAHRAFAKLNLFGMQTLISVVPKGPLTVFPAVDPKDPFQLHVALDGAAKLDAASKGSNENGKARTLTTPVAEALPE